MAVGDIFIGSPSDFGPESVIVKGYIDSKRKQITRLTFIPIMVPHETREPYPVPIAQREEYVTLLTRLSRKYGTKFRVAGDEIAIEGF